MFAKLIRLLLPAVLLSACASATPIPERDRLELSRKFEGRTLYLKGSLFVLPFFSDASRRLVSLHPADSIELLEDTSGNPILPGEPEGLLELGTPVRIEKIELPTGLVVTRRPLYSPRTVPWVYLSVPGAPSSRPYVAVLRQGLKSAEELEAELDRLLSAEDPNVWLRNYPPEARTAVRAKQLRAGMAPELVRLAWGQPERIRQEFVDGIRVETWTWPLGKRQAVFRDQKLTSATPSLAPQQ